MIDFLTFMFENGLGYSAMNTIRSALSSFISIDGIAVGKHPIVIRFLNGVYNLKPVFPKNTVTWDPETLLSFLRRLSPVHMLSLKLLTFKTVTLVTFLTAQRIQSVHLIHIDNIRIEHGKVKITFGDKLKTSRPGFHQKEIVIPGYAPDRRLCLVTVLQEYLKRTKERRNGQKYLFISYAKPFRAVSKSSIARWIRTVMASAGIDLSIFTPHSLRSVATSTAKRKNVSMKTIVDTAGWSNSSTFVKYYFKPVSTEVKTNVAKVILDS